ncbi:hypothetical protein M5X11_24940 [Paenibacillus alginolyticus]|uniref:Uncharacterized protein n=1 Tax=Paenibacillus alginolyticus TaxID=59839 RepID=A0ABT4GMP4_9BACL|nr:hypothetical protein [Paenibacillus alginolyticus]MCY9668129.1 hypothetical protein [Paenibacillus alginolyticus]MCY9697487.1 hypothetical protein [Paenibacillus alginolyticus]MEC0148277.1 hypothetical protein [Paenibacillus alginolyticus]
MNLKRAKRLGLFLQIILPISVVMLKYFVEMNYIWLEFGLVAIIFCVFMCLLFVSENTDAQQVQEKKRLRN